VIDSCVDTRDVRFQPRASFAPDMRIASRPHVRALMSAASGANRLGPQPMVESCDPPAPRKFTVRATATAAMLDSSRTLHGPRQDVGAVQPSGRFPDLVCRVDSPRWDPGWSEHRAGPVSDEVESVLAWRQGMIPDWPGLQVFLTTLIPTRESTRHKDLGIDRTWTAPTSSVVRAGVPNFEHRSGQPWRGR